MFLFFLLQCDLHKVFNWTAENLMTFNIDKFEVLKIGNNDHLKQKDYTTPDGQTLPEKSVVKDLGVILNNKGDFSDHIETKTSKARSIAGLILRTFITRNQKGGLLPLIYSMSHHHLPELRNIFVF